MSALSNTGLPAIAPSALPTSTAPINQAALPASIRNGTPAAKQAYSTALSFEEILLNQLTQELAATATSSGDSGSSGDGSSDGSASGLMGSDPASSVYSQLLPGALTSSVMSAGGTGVALEIARALDPSIGTQQSSAASTTTQPSGGASIAAPAQQSPAVSTATPAPDSSTAAHPGGSSNEAED